MYKNVYFRYTLLLWISLLCACESTPGDQGLFCTEEFRTVGLEIQGDSLDSFYTVRLGTHDTLTADFPIFQNIYPVLTDSYQPILEGKTEEFEFIGFLNEVEAVRETFIIKADRCHIEKVSGPELVSL